jgi:prepilin-type N-terminal cleavage/methylation domain-containing protein
MKKTHTRIGGFTLLELLMVVAIIGLLTTIIMTSVATARKKANDARRVSDMHQIENALELYHSRFNRYPDSDLQGSGGWDTGGDGDFIQILVTNGFLPRNFLDPTTNNASGNYNYYRYATSWNYDGNCANKNFYVLGIVDMESTANPYPASPGFACTGGSNSRNWQPAFEWVTGKFE